MKIIDRWVGIPSCFLLSIFELIRKIIFFWRTPAERPPKSILIIKLSEIGAIILAQPFLRNLRGIYPEADFYFLTFQRNREVFDVCTTPLLPENIWTIRHDNFFTFIFDTYQVLRKMKKVRIEICFDLELFSRFTSAMSYLSGALKRIGFHGYAFEGLYRGNLLTHQVQYNPLLHISKSYYSLVEAMQGLKRHSPELKEKIDDEKVRLIPYQTERNVHDQITQILKERGVPQTSRIFLFNPGDDILPVREWPLEYFVELGHLLLKKQENVIVTIGARNSKRKQEFYDVMAGSKRCFNFCGQTTIPQLMELFGLSEALVSSDCGLAHLAALTAIKKFIFFGPESPVIFGPRGQNTTVFYKQVPCSPCLSAFNHRHSFCRNNYCLKEILPQEVYQVLEENFIL